MSWSSLTATGRDGRDNAAEDAWSLVADESWTHGIGHAHALYRLWSRGALGVSALHAVLAPIYIDCWKPLLHLNRDQWLALWRASRLMELDEPFARSIELWRGQLIGAPVGLSWATHSAVARAYHDGRSRDGETVVLHGFAPVSAVLARWPHHIAQEVIVDPTLELFWEVLPELPPLWERPVPPPSDPHWRVDTAGGRSQASAPRPHGSQLSRIGEWT